MDMENIICTSKRVPKMTFLYEGANCVWLEILLNFANLSKLNLSLIQARQLSSLSSVTLLLLAQKIVFIAITFCAAWRWNCQQSKTAGDSNRSIWHSSMQNRFASDLTSHVKCQEQRRLSLPTIGAKLKSSLRQFRDKEGGRYKTVERSKLTSHGIVYEKWYRTLRSRQYTHKNYHKIKSIKYSWNWFNI